MNYSRRGLSTTASMAVIIVVLIIAIAGWASYFVVPMKTTVTSTVAAQTVTSTKTVNVGSSGGSNTVTQTSTQSASGATTYLSPTSSSVSFTIVGSTQTPDAAQWYIAKDLGFFANLIPGATEQSVTGAQTVAALTSGAAQMAYGESGSFIPAMAQGAPIQFVANPIENNVPIAVFVNANSSYKTLSDLKGATMGSTSVGSANYHWTEYVFSQLGWTVGNQYQITALGHVAAELAALQTGSVQAIVTGESNGLACEQAGQCRALEVIQLPYPYQSLVATTSFIQNHPDAVKAAVEAFLMASAVWNANVTYATSLLTTQYNLNAEQIQLELQDVHYSLDGSMSISGYTQAVNFLLTTGSLTQNITIANYMNNQFVPITS